MHLHYSISLFNGTARKLYGIRYPLAKYSIFTPKIFKRRYRGKALNMVSRSKISIRISRNKIFIRMSSSKILGEKKKSGRRHSIGNPKAKY